MTVVATTTPRIASSQRRRRYIFISHRFEASATMARVLSRKFCDRPVVLAAPFISSREKKVQQDDIQQSGQYEAE